MLRWHPDEGGSVFRQPSNHSNGHTRDREGRLLGGAVGFEMIGGSVAEMEGIESFRYRILTNIEEGLEMAGILVFIYVLLCHLKRSGATLQSSLKFTKKHSQLVKFTVPFHGFPKQLFLGNGVFGAS